MHVSDQASSVFSKQNVLAVVVDIGDGHLEGREQDGQACLQSSQHFSVTFAVSDGDGFLFCFIFLEGTLASQGMANMALAGLALLPHSLW